MSIWEMTTMSDNRIEGAGHQAGGAVKEGFGKLTGDTKLQAEGLAEKTAGSVQNSVGKLQDEPRTFGPDHDRVEGAGHKIVGSIKEGLGKLTGNEKLEAEGLAEKTGGTIQNALGGAKDTVREAFKK
jgi:uncharacterized protein YjbJ (UPF0337 family)